MAVLLALTTALLFLIPKKDEVRFLYATAEGAAGQAAQAGADEADAAASAGSGATDTTAVRVRADAAGATASAKTGAGAAHSDTAAAQAELGATASAKTGATAAMAASATPYTATAANSPAATTPAMQQQSAAKTDVGYDTAAYGHFAQTLNANVRMDKLALRDLSARQLRRYDAVYADPALLQEPDWATLADKLMTYTRNGGRLLLDNMFASRFPAEFLGGAVVKLPAPDAAPQLSFPQAPWNAQGVQEVFRLFTASYFKQNALNGLIGFDWGYALQPTTAQPLVAYNGLALLALNRVGDGEVLLSSSLLPNRYYPTGYDMQSGMDPALGFGQLAAKAGVDNPPTPGTLYFNKKLLTQEPYFNFEFAAANQEYRSELLAYVSKEKLGYSLKKVLGPYGRPAMAFQNHFEAMPAIAQKDGISWAELLKTYNETPSFTLVRNAFYWGQWRESLTVQLNTGTNAQPQFAGELPGSGYASGLHLMSAGQPLRQATFPEYRELAGAIELPYRAYPAAVDLDGDSRTDLVAGSADGFVYVYTNQGPAAAAAPTAYASEPPPPGQPLPDTFGAGRKLELATGEALRLQPYATVHAADVNGDGRADLLVSDESGAVRVLPQLAGGSFGPPAALLAGGRPLTLPGGPAAVAVADVDGDGARDLVAGTADGRVSFYKGAPGAALALGAGRDLVALPAGYRYAAPAVRDVNNDGRPDLVVGSSEGDLQVFVQTADGGWTNSGPLEGASRNQMGSHALVAGHNSVPLWLDVNGDGNDDLVVGGIEFGSPVAIDDPQFPYKEELQAFINYAKTNHMQIEPHLFFHNFKTDEEERQEIALHKQAFDRLGLPWSNPGTNQHTWRMSFLDRLQTLRSENDQGIWYNFGFLPSHAPVISRPMSVWALPFLLDDTQRQDGSRTMLIHTPTPVLWLGDNNNTDVFESMAARDMPIDYFEHIEYHFPIPMKINDLKQFAAYFDKLRTAHEYNFMSEPQMAQSFLTALKGRVTVSRPLALYLWDKLKDRLSPGNPHWHASLVPDTSDVPALAGDYASTLGVALEKGERLAQYSLDTDAEIYHMQSNRFYVGLPQATAISVHKSADKLHLIRSNVPFTLQQAADGAYTLALNGETMQQVKLYSPRTLTIGGEDLKIETDADARTYTVTHFGGPVTLKLTPAP
uniref:VCBS repeat-containing protein n=1 Tax=Paenibacillus athensensis TaxID=1967502 RepID=A0A4Y8Q4K8_9BACL